MIRDGKLIKIHKRDNVAIALEDIKQGEIIEFDGLDIFVKEGVEKGHKIALKNLREDENVIKYGFPIGHTTEAIFAGEYVHTHNLKTNLKGILNYSYSPKCNESKKILPSSFSGYVRENSDVGIRNEIWIINTVGCINKTAEILARSLSENTN